MTFWYLATPYSKYHAGLEAAFEMACLQRALFVKARIPCFCPIVHSHAVAHHGGLDKLDLSIWLPDDAPFMALAKGLVVVKAHGWQESYDIQQEIIVFTERKKPIYFMELGIIPIDILCGPVPK